MQRFYSVMLLSLAALAGVCALVALWAVIGAFSVRNTLVAVESAFGSMVLAAMLLALSWKSYQCGRDKLRETLKKNSSKQSQFE